MKKTLAPLVAVASIGAPLSQAAVISLTGDLANTTTMLPSQGTSAQGLEWMTNDSFSYDPVTPTVALPADYTGPGTGFHGQDGITDVIAFDFDDIYNNLFVDLYGRRGVAPERDDSFDVQFFLGGVLQETVTGGIPDNSGTTTGHGRFTASALTLADSFRIVETGTDTALTFAEVRVNGVPEPSSTALLGLAGMSLLLRRRK